MFVSMAVCDSLEQFTEAYLSGVCAGLSEWLVEFDDGSEEMKTSRLWTAVCLPCVHGLAVHGCELRGVSAKNDVHPTERFVSLSREDFPKLTVQCREERDAEERVLIDDEKSDVCKTHLQGIQTRPGQVFIQQGQ